MHGAETAAVPIGIAIAVISAMVAACYAYWVDASSRR